MGGAQLGGAPLALARPRERLAGQDPAGERVDERAP
jgi:hypothetical protein